MYICILNPILHTCTFQLFFNIICQVTAQVSESIWPMPINAVSKHADQFYSMPKQIWPYFLKILKSDALLPPHLAVTGVDNM